MHPSIHILTTGGTIDKVYFDAKSAFEVGEPQIADILKAVNVSVPYQLETVMRKDSLDMTSVDRETIRRRVEDSASNRILITHGTDTMVETALALRELPGKTIVLVGSLSPARFRSTDAEFNIGFAFGCVQTLPEGVFITMNGAIFTPETVTKNREENRFEFTGHTRE